MCVAVNATLTRLYCAPPPSLCRRLPLQDSRLYLCELDAQFVGKPFEELFAYQLRTFGIVCLGLRRNSSSTVTSTHQAFVRERASTT